MADKSKNEKDNSALTRMRHKGKSDRVTGRRKAIAEAQKNAKKGAPTNKKRRSSWGEYFRGVRIETKKVVWPTRQETVNYTIIVLAACVFFALFLWGLDSGFLAMIRGLFNIEILA